MLNLFYLYTNFIIRRKNKRKWLHKLDKHVHILEEMTYNRRLGHLLYALWYYGKWIPLQLIIMMLPLPRINHLIYYNYGYRALWPYAIYYWFAAPSFLFNVYGVISSALSFLGFGRPDDYAEYEDVSEESYYANDPPRHSRNNNNSYERFNTSDQRTRSSRPNFRDYL